MVPSTAWSVLRRPARGPHNAAGFTLVEMMVTLLITTTAFVSLAALLGTSLKMVTLEKNRNQGNEVATQAIEDLQRLDYNHLGECSAASGAPSGLTDPVYLANCSSYILETPCPAPGVAGTVPNTSYSCTLQRITYQVNRYVAWSDSSHTAKRLAVTVQWTDRVGGHQVTEQSSVRSPDEGSVVGLSGPAFASTGLLISGSASGCTTTPPSISVSSGITQCSVTFTANVSGLPDNVFVDFLSLSGSTPVSSSLALSQVSTNADGTTTWNATLQANSPQFTFGPGTQYINFVADRSADAKATNNIYTPPVTFTCTSSCSGGNSPTLGSPLVTPSPVSTHVTGALCGDINVTVPASNLSTSDLVTANFQTQSGPYTLALAPNSNSTWNNSSWSGVIPASGGYLFNSGTQTIYIAAAQAYEPAPTPPAQAEYGSTTAVQASVNFSGSC